MQDLNILIVEDESLLALNLSLQIKAKGFNVIDYVTNVKSTLQTIQEHKEINLIIMDIHLNDSIDGIDLYNQIERKIPVIYLTAYTDDNTINKAIATEPLGYLVKPVNEKELLALLKLTVFKRNPAVLNHSELLKLPNNYKFDPKHAILFHNGQRVKINGKRLQLLKILVEAKGNFVPFQTLEEELYKDNPPSESSLRTLVYRLRTQLQYDMIETERKYGIRLTLRNL